LRKAQATTREIGLASLMMILLMLYLYLNIPPAQGPKTQFEERCVLGGNLSCSSVLLRRGSSKVELAITQNTGGLIDITSLVCTKKKEIPAVMPALNNPILITPGERAYISGVNSGNDVECTGWDGKSIPTASLGEIYEGSIYITYIEVEAGEPRFVNGSLHTKYS
jgi:hypothetical protein